jgi:hypothetical protein
MPYSKLKILQRGLVTADKGRLATPASLTVAVTGLLPEIILVGEEDSLVTTGLADGLDSLGLLLLTGASRTVALASRRPAALQVDDIVTAADFAEEVKLALDKLTSALGSNLGVEVGVDVSTSDIDNTADGALDVLSLPDVEGLSDGVRTVVTGTLLLDDRDEIGKLLGRAEVVHDGLVTNGEELDLVPLSPLGKSVDLLLDLGGLVGAARGLDENTNDHLNTILLAGRGNGLEGVTVGGVGADDLETSILEGSNILVNLVARLALAGGGLVRSVCDTVVIVSTLQVTGVGGLLGGLGLRLGLRGLGGLLDSGFGVGGGLRDRVNGFLRLGDLRDNAGKVVDGGGRLLLLGGLGLRLRGLVDGLGLLGRLRLGSLRNLSGSGNTGLRVGADINEVGLSDGDDLLGSSVGTRDVAGRDGVDDNGLLLTGLGDGSNGVGASGGAHVGGSLDNTGNDAIVLGLLGVGAGDGGGSLDDGGDTAHGVSSSRNLGGLANTNGGRLGHSHGGGREGVSARSRAVVLLRGWDRNNNLGGGGSNRLGGLVARNLISSGRLRLSSLMSSDSLHGRLGRRRGVGDKSRLAIVSGPDGGAAGNADLSTTTEHLMSTSVVRVSSLGTSGHCRNGSGSNSSLHCEDEDGYSKT